MTININIFKYYFPLIVQLRYSGIERIFIPIDFTFKICIFGDKDVGKSSLTRRYISNMFIVELESTMGANISIKSIELQGKTIALQLWDLNCEERFKSLLPTYAQGLAGGILMFDITSAKSLENGRDWLILVRNNVTERDLKIPIILVGGKLDLQEKRSVSNERAINFKQVNNLYDYIECSAKTGQNVDLIFNNLVLYIMEIRGF